jgi:hypothetical protein
LVHFPKLIFCNKIPSKKIHKLSNATCNMSFSKSPHNWPILYSYVRKVGPKEIKSHALFKIWSSLSGKKKFQLLFITLWKPFSTLKSSINTAHACFQNLYFQAQHWNDGSKWTSVSELALSQLISLQHGKKYWFPFVLLTDFLLIF